MLVHVDTNTGAVSVTLSERNLEDLARMGAGGQVRAVDRRHTVTIERDAVHYANPVHVAQKAAATARMGAELRAEKAAADRARFAAPSNGTRYTGARGWEEMRGGVWRQCAPGAARNVGVRIGVAR